jgi:predicted AAA+ superfamily ATPase
VIDWKKEKVLEGDLVYLPANVKLVQTHNDGTVSRYTLTDKPMGVILTKKNE